MTKTAPQPLTLPALKGVMGKWVYYSCLMSLDQLATRVRYAEEIHKSEQLSRMIQRQLKTGRSKQIAEYLENQPERFFNSLVVATYRGQPNWLAFSDVKSKSQDAALKDLSEEMIESLGFLTLRGDEELFALDGQHRLAGIKKAIKEGIEQDPYDDVSVLLVAHKDTQQGIERTRRLFTTLNKTARPVSKGDIIALDEDDVMAICVRWLIEETDLFGDDRIAFVASNNLSSSNEKSLTTIGNLYDVLTNVFTKVDTELRQNRADLQRVRPADDELDEYKALAREYFELLRDSFPALKEFFKSRSSVPVVKKHRGNHGGHVLFRPAGLKIFSEIIARLSRDMELDDAVTEAARLPTNLAEEPYAELMWDLDNKRIVNTHAVTLREVLLGMLDASKFSEAKNLERYRLATGDEDAELPVLS